MYHYEFLYFMSNKIPFLFIGLNFAINPPSIVYMFRIT